MFNPVDVKTLELEITSYCNAHCPHCPRFDQDLNLVPSLKLQHWNWKTISQNIDLLQFRDLKQIILRGDKGDPMVHPDIEDIVDFFLEAPSKPNILIGTNGSMRSSDFWKTLGSKDSRLVVQFSIDGLADTNHMYRVGTNYKKIINNAHCFIQSGGRAEWRTLVFEHNQHQLQSMQELAKKMNFERINFFLADVGRFQGLSEWPVIFKQSQFTIRPSNLLESEIQKFDCNWQPQDFYYGQRTKGLCPYTSRGHFYITYQGHVVPCCMMHNQLYEYGTPGYDQMIDLAEDEDSINLNLVPLHTIVSSKFYSNLEESFHSKKFHPVCKKSCHSQLTKIQ